MANSPTASRVQIEIDYHRIQDEELIRLLAGGISHDLNNLFTAICGSADLLRGIVGGHPIGLKAVDTIEQAVTQAGDVARALNAFRPRPTASAVTVDMQDVVAEAAEFARDRLPQGVELRVNTDPGGAAMLEGDPARLRQVVISLLVHAGEALTSGMIVQIDLARETVSAQGDRDQIVLTVRDNGPGRNEEACSHLLAPFFTARGRAHNPPLGLAVAQAIVKDAGGRITITSTVGAGTTYTVKLPIGGPHTRSAVASAGAAERPGRGELIVLRESQPYVREVIASALTAKGYRVQQVADAAALPGAGASRADRTDSVRLFILDGDDAGRTLAAFDAVRGSGCDAPAIILTAHDEAVIEGNAGERTLVLRKPFEMAELVRIVERMLAT